MFRKKSKKKIIIPIVLVLLLFVGLRTALEPILLKKANEVGKTASPIYQAHIDDIDLALWRGVVVAEGISVKLKSNNREFVTIEDVDVSIAWRELFRGRVLLDVGVDELNLKVAKDLINSFDALKKDADKQEDKLPIKIERINVTDSRVTMMDYPGLKDKRHLTIHSINADVRNIIPSKKEPIASFDVTASLSDKDDIDVEGQFNPETKPKSWNMDATVKNFVLSDANELLKDKVPLTFKKGTLDLYVEAKSEKNKVVGYVKPFMRDLQTTGNKKDFKGAKHFVVDVLTEVGDDIFENEKTEAVATKVPFTWDHGLKIDTEKAMDKAMQNAFEKKLKPGIENQYKL